MQTPFSATITGTGSYLPEKRLTNDDLAKMVDTNDEWITQRTGIKERRIAAKDESTASMASIAAKRAIEAAGITAKEVDLVLCATITPEMQFPATACFVASSLGLNATPAFDLSAACSGFIYALETAANFIATGRYRNVLVVGAETLSRITDYKDRASCILFGDGAGAVVLQATRDERRGVIYSSLHSDGSGWEVLCCRPGSRHPLDLEALEAGAQYMQIRGREVYKFAVTRFEELIEDAMRKCELKPEDIKLIVPHQVNQRIIDSAMEKLGMPPEQAYVNIAKYGNTSAASIPLALDRLVEEGQAKSGDTALFIAFGAGLAYAAQVVRIP
jgi:3-oxoacyl-[acyl-carrier-protein] synthase III